MLNLNIIKTLLFTGQTWWRTKKKKREKERIRKANWRQKKRNEDPEYFTKICSIERKRNRLKRKLSQEPECPDTPKKRKSPPYYMVLNRSKEVWNIWTESPETHTTILKHKLKHTMKSPRKSSMLDNVSTLTESNKWNFITPAKNCNPNRSASSSKEIRKIAILKSHRKEDKLWKKQMIWRKDIQPLNQLQNRLPKTQTMCIGF